MLKDRIEPAEPESGHQVARIRTVLIEGENLIRTMLARLLLLSERLSLLADFEEAGAARETCLLLRPQLVVIDVDFAPEESVGLIEILRNASAPSARKED